MSRRARDPRSGGPAARPSNTLDLALRGLALAALWWVLNEGSLASWALGAPAVLLALLLSRALLPAAPWRLRGAGLLRFILYFVQKSLLSSIDVAGRVLRPRMPLKPGLLRYRMRLRGSLAPVLMANSTSLMPGTLSVGLEGDELVVHALDLDAPLAAELRRLEERIAAIYEKPLPEETH